MKHNIVILFHEIHDVEWFAKVLNQLESTYHYVTANELADALDSMSMSSNLCHITFDDGHLSFFQNAFPILKAKEIPASLFVSPERIMKQENYWLQRVRELPKAAFSSYVRLHTSDRFSIELNSFNVYSILKCLKIQEINVLIDSFRKEKNSVPEKYVNITKEQLIDVSDSGLIEIGAHTQNHPILANEEDTISNTEISNSIHDLQVLLEKKIVMFAYPNGQPDYDFTSREKIVLRENNIRLGFSTSQDHLSAKYDRYSVPRIGLTKGTKYEVSTKVRFAKQWIHLRNFLHNNTEENERKLLKKYGRKNE